VVSRRWLLSSAWHWFLRQVVAEKPQRAVSEVSEVSGFLSPLKSANFFLFHNQNSTAARTREGEKE
jgi:hypothetical protein